MQADRGATRRIAVYLGLTFALSAIFYGLIISAGTLKAEGEPPLGGVGRVSGIETLHAGRDGLSRFALPSRVLYNSQAGAERIRRRLSDLCVPSTASPLALGAAKPFASRQASAVKNLAKTATIRHPRKEKQQ